MKIQNKAYPTPCVDCGLVRNVQYRNGKPTRERCRRCANILNGKKSDSRYRIKERNPHWKDGVSLHEGYVVVRIDKTDPFYEMVDNTKYVKRSRLVVARSLGRCLTHSEHVHHINGDITDDVIGNLQLMSSSTHSKLHWQLRGEQNAETD